MVPSRTGKGKLYLFLAFIMLVVSSFSLELDAQTDLYARQNGDWSTSGTWSESTTGNPAYAGVPSSLDNVHIGYNGLDYTVTISDTVQATDVTIHSGGVLSWLSGGDYRLEVYNSGTFWIRNGGYTLANGNTTSRIIFQDNGTYLLRVIDAPNGLQVGEIWTGDNVTLNIQGGGSIELLDDLEFAGDNGNITNDLADSFLLGGTGSSLLFAAGTQDNTFTNNQTISIANRFILPGLIKPLTMMEQLLLPMGLMEFMLLEEALLMKSTTMEH